MLFSMLLLCATALLSPGENLVVNGRLETDQTELPSGWLYPERAKIGEAIVFDQSGGPSGMPCVRFVNSGKPEKYSFRQLGFTLVPGAKYRLSAYVRTKGFSGRGFVYVVSNGWAAEAGFGGAMPADSPWTLKTKDITAPKNSNPKTYQTLFYVADFTGEISFADLKLEPLDDAAKKGSKPPPGAECEKLPRFFPWSPRLTKIDAADRRATFRFEGKLPPGDAFADYAVTMKTGDACTSFTLAEGGNPFTLPGSLSVGRLSFEVRKRGAGTALLAGSFPFRTVERSALDTGGHRRLNNLVTELLSAPVSGDAKFCADRDGWVFIRVETVGGECPETALDGRTVMPAGSSRREAFRRVRAGMHTLSFSGANGGRVTVRRIPEIVNYPSCADSPVNTNPSYGWDFFSRHVMPNCTTHCGGQVPAGRWDEFKMHGGDFLDNIVTRGMDAEGMCSRLLKSRALTRARCDGVALDEHLFGDPQTFGDFVGGMRLFTAKYDGGRRIYTWTVCKPLFVGFDREVFALAAHASPDGSRVMSEVYCRSRATEEEAQRHIEDYLVDTGRKFREIRKGVEFYPDAMSDLGMILGNFSQIPTISVWHHPQMDMKYFLDMQFNALAGNPVFDGLGCVGVWGSYYCDEEIYRWTFMLARHYCIEGRKEMLSERFGLKYLPGHVVNGDFQDGISGWCTEGAVRHGKMKGLAENVERRWGGTSSGDAFAVLEKAGDRTARIGQTLKGLVPGKKYSLDVVCFDAKDAKAKKHRPARHPVTVTLGDGALKDDALSWVFVDRRPVKDTRGWGVRCNRHHTVFTAKSEEVTLAIDNAAASDGDETGVNWIGVWPYVSGWDPDRN